MIKLHFNRSAILKSLKSFFLLFMAAVMVYPTYAAMPSDDILDMFNKNGIYYYNPAGNEDNCNASSTTLSGSDNAEKIWNYFISKGFTDAQTAGILGNAMGESSLEPTRASNDSYWGLFQWGGGRKDSLFAKMTEAGLSQYLSSDYWGSGASKNIPQADLDKILQVELDFTMSEQDMDWQNEIKKANTPEMAAEIFLVLFERAVGGSSEILYYSPYAGLLYQGTKTRRDAAKQFFDQYSGKGVSVANGSATAENGKNITIIGDSIANGSRSAFTSKFKELSDTNINAVDGRGWNQGVEIAKTIQLNNIVVFELGTNTSNLTEESINNAISAIGPDKKIVFVTNYGGNNTTYDSNNALFKTFAKNNSNIIIADWAATVSQKPDIYLEPDQIHPNSAGSELLADTIYKAINSNTNENGCSVSGEFSSLVLSYAWPEYHAAPYVERMPAYADAVTKSLSEGRYVGGSVFGVPGIDCGGFVTILVQNSGLEPNYNDGEGGTDTQEAWVQAHNWQLLNSAAGTAVDTSILQPGDIAFSSGHTFIYVGEISGFGSVIASASYGESSARAPMAGHEDPIFGNGVYVRWYRSPNFNPGETTGTAVDSTNGLINTNNGL